MRELESLFGVAGSEKAGNMCHQTERPTLTLSIWFHLQLLYLLTA